MLFCVFENSITRVKSDVFSGLFFDALFFKSIIDLGISMSGHIFLCRIFWLLVLPTRGYCARGELEGRWPKHSSYVEMGPECDGILPV